LGESAREGWWVQKGGGALRNVPDGENV